jgi:hypothetical protein
MKSLNERFLQVRQKEAPAMTGAFLADRLEPVTV